MGTRAEAILFDGRTLPYIIERDPPRGGMKHTYFSPDGSYVVQFFNDPARGRDERMHRRLEAIVGKYNPTRSEEEGGARGNTPEMAAYFSKLFCWPYALVKYPEFGIVCPAYPACFFFDDGAAINPELSIRLRGKDKRSRWFTSGKLRQYLKVEEVGDFRSMLQMSISLSRAIRRMHQAGLSHTDLSCNNVLIDPLTGGCVVIDIDSLVVPGIYPPEVVGTPGYIAPEVLETMRYDYDDARRRLPCAYTDLHALAVLIYEYLLLRHPLMGPKIHSQNVEEDDYMMMGPGALFVEHPTDGSNRRTDLHMTISDLGAAIEELFLRAFVDGLHAPDQRPTAMEWEKGLVKSWDLLYPCENPDCAAKWFILHRPSHPVCPFCGRRVSKGRLARLYLKRQMRGAPGQWIGAGEINLYHHMPLFQWHMESDRFPDEKANRSLWAYVCYHQGEWLLVNQKAKGMISPNGTPVPPGQAIVLRQGDIFRLCGGARGLAAEVAVY